MSRRLAQEIILPADYSSPLYLRTVVRACRDGLRVFVRRLQTDQPPTTTDLKRLGSAGRRQAELGVPLEVLLRAYRLAAKVVWEEAIAESLQGIEISPSALLNMTAQVLEYLDEISVLVGQAYLETREENVRQRERDRERVLQRLIAGDASDDVRRLAASCDLELSPPYDVAVVATEDTLSDRMFMKACQLVSGIFVALGPHRWAALIPQGDGADRMTRDLLVQGKVEGSRFTFGISHGAYELSDVARVARWAERSLDTGLILRPKARVHQFSELGIFASLSRQGEVASPFVAQLMGRLATSTTLRDDAMRASLAMYLETGNIAVAATRLGIHRHTMVYRLARLNEILPVDLQDPVQQHLLWVALQLHRLQTA